MSTKALVTFKQGPHIAKMRWEYSCHLAGCGRMLWDMIRGPKAHRYNTLYQLLNELVRGCYDEEQGVYLRSLAHPVNDEAGVCDFQYAITLSNAHLNNMNMAVKVPLGGKWCLLTEELILADEHRIELYLKNEGAAFRREIMRGSGDGSDRQSS